MSYDPSRLPQGTLHPLVLQTPSPKPLHRAGGAA